jgi:hypothetical protein
VDRIVYDATLGQDAIDGAEYGTKTQSTGQLSFVTVGGETT